MKKNKNALTMKTLTKSNVWDIQETDIFRLWEAAEKDADLKDNIRHYTDILRGAFEIEEVKVDKPEIIKKYEERGFKIGTVRTDDSAKVKWAIRKRPIMRVTDLTYENIRHISAQKLLEVLDRNFGGGWDSLSQSIKDIIEHGFDISTTTLPQDRLHKTGGMYENEGQSDRTEKYSDDDDDSYDEDKLTEESYRTTFDTDPEDLNLEAEDVSDEEAF